MSKHKKGRTIEHHRCILNFNYVQTLLEVDTFEMPVPIRSVISMSSNLRDHQGIPYFSYVKHIL